MTALAWDASGERAFETGVDRGVLGLPDSSAVVWNGLITVEESANTELKSYYLEGRKFLENLTPEDFVGKLKAYTYPEEFEQFNGITQKGPGLLFYEQPRREKFNLSYRTKIGNDADADAGYKIHFLYNLLAEPDTVSRQTEDSSIQAIELSWNLTGIPVPIATVRPAVHVALNSLTTDPEILAEIEGVLYGTEETDPRFLSMEELAGYLGYIGGVIITDNGDGTWTATGAEGTHITMIDPTEFQIDNVDATYLDADTFTVSSTPGVWV